MWLFKSRLEKQIEEAYMPQLIRLHGDTKAAREDFKVGLAICKALEAKEGTDKLPEQLGDIYLGLALFGKESTAKALATKIVSTARLEGATDDDIREWWNIPSLARRMLMWSELTFRFISFKSLQADGAMGADAAMARVRRMFPMYGDPSNDKDVQGDDCSLPHELRGRVDAHREQIGASAIMAIVETRYSTFNAYVRAMIREGKL